MQLSDQKEQYGVFFILLFLVFVFGLAFYNSAKSTVKPYERFREKVRNQSFLYGQADKLQLPTDQILLKKGEKLFIQKNGLVYKGLSNGLIHVDLYLLQFDPDMPYSKQFNKEIAQDGIWLGDVLYQPIKVKKDYLHLKILKIRESG